MDLSVARQVLGWMGQAPAMVWSHPLGLLEASCGLFLGGFWAGPRELSAESLRRILDALPVPAYIKDVEGRVLFINAAMREYVDSLGATLGKTAFERYSKEIAEEVNSLDRLALAGQKVIREHVVEMRGAGQKEMWVTARTAVRATEWGDVVVGVAENVTSRRAAERELAREHDFISAILDVSTALVMVLDAEGRIVRFNPACETVTGYSFEEVRGQYYWEVFAPPGTRDHAHQRFLDLLEDGRTAAAEAKWITKHGEPVVISWSRSVLRGSDGEVEFVVGTGIDVTEQKRNEHELQLAKNLAESASAAKSQFLANISHEIRTPMNAILGLTDLALATDLNEVQREYLSMAQTSADSLLVLLNDLLDFSKIEAGRMTLDPVRFRLRETVEAVVKTLAMKALSKGLRLAHEIAAGVPDELIGDSRRLRQVLLNLVGNAVKFTERGHVVIRIQTARAASGECSLRFDIADTGIGIAPDKQGVIFEPFIQADGSTTRKYGGTGLGLSISSRLVEMMGGCLSCHSEVGSGSTFSFEARFGVVCSEASCGDENAVRDRRTAVSPGQELRILVAEDNLTNQQVITRLLRNEGHSVVIARNGREAVEVLKNTTVDLVLMDLQMPELDGLEAARAIRASERGSGRHLPILAMTANDLRIDRDRSKEAGMDGFLNKPVGRQELLKALDDVAAGGASGTSKEPDAGRRPALLDLEMALSRVSDDPELLREVAHLFLEDYPKALDEIRRAAESRDAQTLERSAHSLKGSVANFGAEPVVQAALRLETMGRNRSLEQAAEALAQLEAALERLRPELESL